MSRVAKAKILQLEVTYTVPSASRVSRTLTTPSNISETQWQNCVGPHNVT
jgi:hypothetical protein